MFILSGLYQHSVFEGDQCILDIDTSPTSGLATGPLKNDADDANVNEVDFDAPKIFSLCSSQLQISLFCH